MRARRSTTADRARRLRASRRSVCLQLCGASASRARRAVVGLRSSMGGPQRPWSGAGRARARELVYTARAVRRRDARLERRQPAARAPRAAHAFTCRLEARLAISARQALVAPAGGRRRGADAIVPGAALVVRPRHRGAGRRPGTARTSAACDLEHRFRLSVCLRQDRSRPEPGSGGPSPRARGVGTDDGHRDGQVVLRRQGLRLHHARRGRPRPLRPLLAASPATATGRWPRARRSPTRRRRATRAPRRSTSAKL